MNYLVLLSLLAGASSSIGMAEEPRQWVDNTGRFSADARFVDATDDRVRLEIPGRKIISVPIDRLSQRDRAYVQSLLPQGDPVQLTSVVGNHQKSASPTTPWPKYRGRLPKGRNVLSIINPNKVTVVVGLRSAGRGLGFSVPAGKSRTVYVPDGHFDVYFRYRNKPAVLYQGDSVHLAGNRVEIQLVQVSDGNYAIRPVQ